METALELLHKEDVWLASDNADAAVVPDGEIVYRSRELSLLFQATPDGLNLVHETKRWFGAEITAEKPLTIEG